MKGIKNTAGRMESHKGGTGAITDLKGHKIPRAPKGRTLVAFCKQDVYGFYL